MHKPCGIVIVIIIIIIPSMDACDPVSQLSKHQLLQQIFFPRISFVVGFFSFHLLPLFCVFLCFFFNFYLASKVG